VPDDIQGEKLVAVLVPRGEAPKDLQQYLKSKLAAYKIPRIELYRDTIERNHLGKVRILHSVVTLLIMSAVLFPGKQESIETRGNQRAFNIQEMNHFK
jgi:hypothetical protein